MGRREMGGGSDAGGALSEIGGGEKRTAGLRLRREGRCSEGVMEADGENCEGVTGGAMRGGGALGGRGSRGRRGRRGGRGGGGRSGVEMTEVELTPIGRRAWPSKERRRKRILSVNGGIFSTATVKRSKGCVERR